MNTPHLISLSARLSSFVFALIAATLVVGGQFALAEHYTAGTDGQAQLAALTAQVVESAFNRS